MYRLKLYFNPFKKSYLLHFYLLQFVAFFYSALKILSRDYSHFGLLPDELRQYSWGIFSELNPIPISHFTTFQFIYEIIPFPSPEIITLIQIIIAVSSLMGLLGLFPKVNSVITFLLYLHVHGMLSSVEAGIEGNTVLLFSLLILFISPHSYFYSVRKFKPRNRLKQWPIFLFILSLGSFYFFSGLYKLIDVGFKFPFTLSLHKLMLFNTENSIFLNGRNFYPEVTSISIINSELFSIISGFIVLLSELGFIFILFSNSIYRFLSVVFIGIMHVIIYYTAAINFMGNLFLLLLCLDWNILLKKLTVIYDYNCTFCYNSLIKVKKLDFFNVIKILPSNDKIVYKIGLSDSRLRKDMISLDSEKKISYGHLAWLNIFNRIILLWPFAFLIKLPFGVYFGKLIYRYIANNRSKFGGDANCEI